VCFNTECDCGSGNDIQTTLPAIILLCGAVSD
jgi:hypothetical protein